MAAHRGGTRRRRDSTVALARFSQVVWHYRQSVLLLAVGLLAGLVVATLVNRPGLTPAVYGEPEATTTTGVSATAVDAGDPTGAVEAPPLQNGRVQPGELLIPDIDVRATFVNLGLNRDGTLEAPPSYDVVGWYAGGPAPGDAGGQPAVIAGHVDSRAGPAVFYRLHELKTGSLFQIGGTDGTVRTFKVYRTATYKKDDFPAQQVYAKGKGAEVRLITCTGTVDQGGGHYEGNLVAYAALVRT